VKNKITEAHKNSQEVCGSKELGNTCTCNRSGGRKEISIHGVIHSRSCWKSKGMYNDREDVPSLSDPHHLEKTTNISGTMHYLLLSFLATNKNQLNFIKK
jgi:hypothetical protein